MGVDLIGWASAAVLLATILNQVRQQWISGSTAGVSAWLFIGQTTASAGFSIYSALTASWVFLVVNIALLLSGLLGQLVFWRNRRRDRRRASRSSPAA